jgi:hypothetical protein
VFQPSRPTWLQIMMEYIGFPPRRFGALKSLALGIMVGMLKTLQEQLSCRCTTLLVSTWNHQAYTFCHVSVGANSEQFDSTFRLQSVTPRRSATVGGLSLYRRRACLREHFYPIDLHHFLISCALLPTFRRAPVPPLPLSRRVSSFRRNLEGDKVP